MTALCGCERRGRPAAVIPTERGICFWLRSCGAGTARATNILMWGDEMDFQVNEQTYFLSLAEDERRWKVFVSTPTGAWRIPVYEDAADSDTLVVLQDEKHRLPN